MSNNPTKGKGIKLKPRLDVQEPEEMATVIAPPPRDIYQSVVDHFGFDPLKEKRDRLT